MRLPPRFSLRARRVLTATFAAVLLAAATITAQFAVFNEGFEGEIWELIATLDLPTVNGGDAYANWASGAAWVNGELFVADNYSAVINKFDQNLQLVDLPNADWYGADGTPSYGWAPNEAISAAVVVNGQPAQQALVVSDFNANRMFAFWPNGQHIFTVELPDPDPGVTIWGLNGVALSVGGYFTLTQPAGSDPTLQVVGRLAAAWPEYYGIASGGALIYDSPSFVYNNATGQFDASAPDRVLTGGVAETGDASIPAAKALTGVTFDSAGNFYMVDSWTGRLHAYDTNFVHQFTYGTPDATGETTLEFQEAYGMTLWPSAAGDRLLITVPYQNAAVVYAPSPRTGTPTTLEFLFQLDGLGAVDGLPHSSAFDAVNGRVAVSDSGDNSVKVFQTPTLAVFDLRVANTGGQSVATVCAGENYSVSFSITVPEGRSTVQGVSPVLRVNEAATTVPPAAGGSYGSSNVGPLAARDVISYSYSFTAPNAGVPLEIDFTASAVGTTTSVGAGGESAAVTDILEKLTTLAVVDCGGGNVAPSITASVPIAPEASGWTRIVPTVPAPVSFILTLNGADSDGTVTKIAYRATGTHPIVPTEVAAASVPITISQPGVTTVFFKAQDDDLLWSVESSLTIRLDNTLPSICLSIPPAPGQKSQSEWWWNGPVTIPVLVLDSQDVLPQLVEPFPPQLVGTDLVFPDEGALQVATLTARDHAGHERVLASNTTLDVCGPGRIGRNINIDMTKPAASGNLVEGTLYQSPVTLTISGQDVPAASDGSESGVAYIDYSVDNFATFSRVAGTSAPVVLHTTTTIQFRAVDWAGNAGDAVEATYQVNTAPQAVADAYSTNEDTALIAAAPGVLGNDTDADGNPLTAALVSGPAHGTLAFNVDGSFSYTPAANYFGPDSFTYRASDGLNDSNAGTVTITVNAVNDVPIATDDAYSVNEDATLVVPPAGVLANDSDIDSDPLLLTAVLVAGPAHGVLALSADGSIIYTPQANYSGSDTFTYRTSDGIAVSNVATVTVAVNPVADAPAAFGDSYSTNEDTPLAVAAPGVLGNDADADGSALTALLVTGPAHGTLTLNADGSFTYTPAADYSGPDSFTYRANDGAADSNLAIVSITVNEVNDAPVAADDVYATDEDAALHVPARGVLVNDSDVDSGALTLTAALVTGPAHGTLTLNADGSFTYTPHSNYSGSDSFTYRAGDATATSNAAVVVLTVRPVNDPPVAANDAVSTPYGTAVIIPVLANDTASDAGDTIAVQSVSSFVGGVAVANADGTVTFIPAPGFSGSGGFDYTVVDSGGLAATASVAVTVRPDNIEPICSSALATTDLWPPNHKQIYVTVGGVVDPEGLPLTVTFTSILQDEPTDSVGQGNTLQDGGIEMNGARAWVRAERAGTKKVPGDGRVYLIGFTATDAGGLSCTGTVRLDVPHDQRGAAAVLSPGRWNSVTGQLVTPP